MELPGAGDLLQPDRRQLTAPGAPELVKKAIERYHIPPGRLGVELTEQDALSGAPQMTERLAALRETGARIIMDDFGMGHNSMLYLQDSQFDMVKLDGSLVREMTDNPRTGEIISTIVRLSESLGFRVVAEYVETPAQLEALGALGCRYYQGVPLQPRDSAFRAEEVHPGALNAAGPPGNSAEGLLFGGKVWYTFFGIIHGRKGR